MPSPALPKQWTTRELLRWMGGHFAEKGLDSPRVYAEMLLTHVLQCERMKLYMEVDRPASAEELATLRELVRRAGKHEPVQYLVGHAWFFSRRFEVDRSTLIPRPSTETVVEEALQWIRRSELAAPRILDLCTGSGCIAISIAAQCVKRRGPGSENLADPDAASESQRDADAAAEAENDAGSGTEPLAGPFTGPLDSSLSTPLTTPGARPGSGSECHLVATDLVPGAIALARRNAAAHGVQDRIEFRVGSLWDALAGDESSSSSDSADSSADPVTDPTFDLICANPPYISDSEWDAVPPNVKEHEPDTALRGGADGLDLIRTIISGAAWHLRPGGLLLVEIADTQEDAVLDLARAAKLVAPRVIKDFEGLPRVLAATAP